MGHAYVVGTFDTKGDELRHVAALIRAAGHDVTTVDVATQDPDAGDADVGARTVAAAHPDGADAVFTGDRGSSVAAMSAALERFLPARGDVGGVLGLGGSGGTALVTPAMRRLPVGVPKIMVSTVASGDVAPYVGAVDITMMPSVTDVAGLNRISRRVLGNAAHALAGALSAPPVETGTDLPAAGLTMFGVTTPCVTAVTEALRAEWDCLVFHATGTGGRAMEKLVDDGLLGAVCDVSTTEIADHVAGGIMAADADRLGAIARTGVPWVGSVGALDMVNFGAPGTVPERFRDRVLYEHNAQVTLMRTTPDECRAAATFLVERLTACPGPVRLVLPTGGISALDAPGMPFADPAADDALFETLRAGLGPDRLIETPHHVNDPAFAVVLLEQFRTVTAAPPSPNTIPGSRP